MRNPAQVAALMAAVALFLCAWFVAAGAGELTFFERGEIPALLEFSAGAFAPLESTGRDTSGHDATAIFQFDGISRWMIVNFWDYFQVNPYVGGFVTAKASRMGYLGIHGTAPLGAHFEASPFFAIGAYGRGNGRDLGSTALFHAGLQGMYVFDSGYHAGITFSHESNATALPRNHGSCVCNPGTNNFLLTAAVPFTRIF